MNVKIHPHAKTRLVERGAVEEEVIITVKEGEEFPAKFGRIGFRRNFPFNSFWRGNYYQTKQIEAYTVKEKSYIIVITVIVKYF